MTRQYANEYAIEEWERMGILLDPISPRDPLTVDTDDLVEAGNVRGVWARVTRGEEPMRCASVWSGVRCSRDWGHPASHVHRHDGGAEGWSAETWYPPRPSETDEEPWTPPDWQRDVNTGAWLGVVLLALAFLAGAVVGALVTR